MIYTCNIHCHTINPDKLDLMGLDEDPGKWMPFAFHLDHIVACKLASDDEDLLVKGCTTLFTDNGDTYIIDTPFLEFQEIFKAFHNDAPSSGEAIL